MNKADLYAALLSGARIGRDDVIAGHHGIQRQSQWNSESSYELAMDARRDADSLVASLAYTLWITTLRGQNATQLRNDYLDGVNRRELTGGFTFVIADLVQYLEEFSQFDLAGKMDSRAARKLKRDLEWRYDLSAMSAPPPVYIGRDRYHPNAFNPFYGVRQPPRTLEQQAKSK